MTNLILVLSVSLALGTCALAGELDVPAGDPFAALLVLITNFKALSPVAIASLSISIVVQSLRKFLPSSTFRKAAVVGLSIGYATLQSVLGGLGLIEALGFILLTSGGAVAFYDFVIKPFLKKQVS